ATYHHRFDAPLQSDIASMAGTVSGWVRSSADAASCAGDAAEAVAGAGGTPGQGATLALPADVSWTEGGVVAPPVAARAPRTVADDVVTRAAKARRSGSPGALLLGGSAVRAAGLRAASAVAQATGAKLLCE